MKVKISFRGKSVQQKLSALSDLLFCQVSDVILTKDGELEATVDLHPKRLSRGIDAILASVRLQAVGDGTFQEILQRVDKLLSSTPGYIRGIIFGGNAARQRSGILGRFFLGIPLYSGVGSIPQETSVVFLLSSYPTGSLGTVDRILVGDLT